MKINETRLKLFHTFPTSIREHCFVILYPLPAALPLHLTDIDRLGLFGQRLGRGRHREAELAVFALHAAHNDLALMQVDNLAHDVQPQANTGLVHASGAVGLVKPVEDFGDLLLRDALAGIFDMDVGALLLHRIADLDIAALVDKLDGVFQQVVDHLVDPEEVLPIGIPFRNTGILLLKEDGTEAKNGEYGEICVKGTCLALGYYHNPEKTRESFVCNPLNTAYAELIYKTGDLGAQSPESPLSGNHLPDGRSCPV
mgnify:CR=1 FL=1